MEPFQDIDLKTIKDYLILLDIDGTLVHDSQDKLDPLVIEKVALLKEKNEIHLCSNSRNHKRNQAVASQLDLPYIQTDLRKPSKAILDLIDVDPSKKKMVIGDKLTTDGLFARNIGAEFVKVERIQTGNETPYIKLLYWVDDALSKMIKL